MIIKERYGVRPDGNTVVETSTYIEVPEDHPLAEELEGTDGFWARVAIGNSLVATGAKPVSHAQFQDAKEDHRLQVEAKQEQLQQEIDQHRREIEDRKAAAISELKAKGIPLESIQALLGQAKTGR